jgi:hypothetical protein
MSIWKEAYDAVYPICLKYSKHPYGEDFLLVKNYDWCVRQQILVALNSRYLSPALAKELELRISKPDLKWMDIIVGVCFSENGEEVNETGILIFSGGALELWDLESMRFKFGSGFYS